MSLRRYSWRSLQVRLGRTILTTLSIVLGVAAIVAVGLLTDTTRGAYSQMFATVNGKASLEIDSAGSAGFHQNVLAKVEHAPGVQAAVPLVDRASKLFAADGVRLRFKVLGIDPTRDGQVRQNEIVAGRQLGTGDELVLDEAFARRIHVKVGDEVGLLTRRLKKPFKVVGLMRPHSGAVLRQASLAFMPIDRARYHFNPRSQPDLIDSIQVVAAPGQDVDELRGELQALLPDEISVHRPAGSTQIMRDTLKSSERGLTIASIFTLLLSMAIILNTLMMSVSERRRHFAIMRAIGATKGQITRALVMEAFFLGIVGVVIGTIIGWGLAWLLRSTLASTLDVQIPLIREVVRWQPFAIGAVFGLGMALVGSIIPARRAGMVSPLEGLNRVQPTTSRQKRRYYYLSGWVLILIGGILIFLGVREYVMIDAAIGGSFMVLLGMITTQLQVLTPQVQIAAFFLRPIARVEAGLAQRQLLRNTFRSGLTIGMLFLAGSVVIFLASSLLDNVRDVREWYKHAVIGDYFVRAMLPDVASGTAPDLPDGLVAEIEAVPHITSLDKVAFIGARLPGVKEDRSDTVDVICIARDFKQGGTLPFDLAAGDPKQLTAQLQSGEVVIGSVLAQKQQWHLGSEIPLETVEGVKKFHVCGINNEYAVGGMAVYLSRPFAERYLGVQGYDAIIVHAEPAHLTDIRPQLEQLAEKYDVLVNSNTELSASVDRMVRGIEAGLWSFIYLCFIVASLGVVITLKMSVLEQTRELGMLRIVAMTRRQVRMTIIFQGMIIAVCGLPPGLAAGVGIAWLMNKTMEPTFGHSIEFQFHPWLIIATFFGALVIVLLAAILPALRAMKIDISEALRYE